MKQGLLCIFFLFSACSALCFEGETIKFAFSSGRPVPYVIDENSGIEVEIVKKAFEAVGVRVVPVWLSYKRMALIREMGIDGRGVTKPVSGSGLYYSDPYVYYQDVALTRSDAGIRLNNVKEMAGLQVGGWQTAPRDIGGEFWKLFGPDGTHVHDFSAVVTDYRRVKMLWVGHLDVVVTDLLIFDHFTRMLSKELGRKLDYDIHWLWGTHHWFYCAFKKERHKDLFNKGLDRLRSTGVYEKIYQKYTAWDMDGS